MAWYRRDEVTYTLFRCTEEDSPAYYRVYEADETDPYSPAYRLHPYNTEEEGETERHPSYREHTIYNARDVVSRWPLFAQHTGGFLREYDV